QGFQSAELVLPDGARIHFDRTSSGTSYQNAMFVHTDTPTEFYGSRLGWIGREWALRFQDHALARLRGCGLIRSVRAREETSAVMHRRKPPQSTSPRHRCWTAPRSARRSGVHASISIGWNACVRSMHDDRERWTACDCCQ